MSVYDMLKLLLISLAGILVISIGSADGCSCMPAHPQSHYCSADFVIIARILRKSQRTVQGNDVYKIEIKNTYKMSEKAEHYLKEGRILTPQYDSMCGVELKIGKLYVLAGRGSTLSLCDYTKEYKHMSIVERRGFSGAYKKGCDCQITTCFRDNCELPYGSCKWAPFGKCETDYSACVPFRGSSNNQSISKPTKCHWRRTPLYKSCLSDP